MTLWKRGGVYWTYVWMNGVRYAKSTQTGTKTLARKIDDQYKEELLLGQTRPNRLKPDMTFGELAALFLAESGPKPYHVDRLKILLPYFADTTIGDINRGVAREYRKYRHEKKKPISETTVNRDLEVLRHILFWAVDAGYLAANSLSRMPMVRERRKARPVMSLDRGSTTALTRGTTPPSARRLRPRLWHEARGTSHAALGAYRLYPSAALSHSLQNGGGRGSRDPLHQSPV